MEPHQSLSHYWLNAICLTSALLTLLITSLRQVYQSQQKWMGQPTQVDSNWVDVRR